MNLEIRALKIPAIKLISVEKREDVRGFFAETYHKKAFADAGIFLEFVQDNHAYSAAKHVLRGLHYQSPPFAQDKLIRVAQGRIWDVAVDLRRSSPTFGQWVAAEISAQEWNQILVPIGFAHGYLTLEPDTEIMYKVTDFYSPDHDLGIQWNDPALAIDWPASAANIVLSERDTRQPLLKDATYLFD
jgi:dTDP-4-dehydrorhamnose 3,5-epimerase